MMKDEFASTFRFIIHHSDFIIFLWQISFLTNEWL
jgi:hypothetical protein